MAARPTASGSEEHKMTAENDLRKRVAFTFVMWVVHVVALVVTLRIEERVAVLLPAGVVAIGLLMATAALFVDVRAVVSRSRSSDPAPSTLTAEGVAVTGTAVPDERSELSILVWLGLMGVLVLVIGMLPAFAVFTVVFMVWYGRERLWVAAVMAVAITTVIYLLTAQLLNVRLYPGALPLA